MIKLFDTFAWVWWFHLALEQSIWKENVDCIGYSEIDKFAKQVYNERFSWCKDLWSITELDIDNLEDFDLLTGWFPCQDVSVAWKQNLEWWRTVLVEYLLQILEKKQPKYFVFENVKWFMNKKFTAFRESIFDRINAYWYNLSYEILNTKDFWLPQNRERVFIVWWLSQNWWWKVNWTFPYWKKLTTFLKDILEEEVDEKYYMTPKQYNWLSYDSIKRIYNKLAPTLDTMQWWHRQPKIITNVNPSWKWMNWNIYRTDIESPTLTTNKWEWIKILSTQIWNSKKFWNAVRANGIWYTLKWNTGHWIIYPDYKIRKLTPTECCRLQWFPDTWSTDFVSNSQAYKQMWNAVSVPVVKSIFDNLFNKI